MSQQLQISGFEVLECLGQGGMAAVWKARQLSLDRIVAIKVLSQKMSGDISDIERFLKEAKSAAKLKHPGIIQVYDVNAEEGVYYIVMEYVAGYTVGDWLRRKGVLSEEDALLVVDSVADALDYAWGKEGIIHCDIKPDNIIIDSDGTVKIADLGLARTINAMSTHEEEYIMGTPAYMAPEQARGEPDLDCRADIYSLGAMLYHLITGKMLFEGSSDDEMMELQTSDATVPDPLDIHPKLSRPICWLTEKMLAKDKNNRPVDWAAIRADIAKVKKGRMPMGPALPEGLSAMERSPKRTAHDFTHAPKPQFRQESTSSFIVKVIVLLLIAGAAVGAFFYLTNQSKKQQPAHKVPVIGVQPPPRHVPTEQNAMEMFEFANKWAAENRGNYAEAIIRFEKVARETKGTKYSLMAEDEVRKQNAARDEEIAKVLGGLNESAKTLVLSSEFDKACKVYEDYSGRMAEETAEKRSELVKVIRKKQKIEENEKKEFADRVEKMMVQLIDKAVSRLVSDGVKVAHTEVLDLAKAPELVSKEKEIKTISSLFDSAIAIDSRILDSFAAQMGKEITVNLSNSQVPVTLTVTNIVAGKLFAARRISPDSPAMKPVEFDVSSLSSGEKLKRMGSDDLPEVALLKGLMAYSSKAYGPARKYFGATKSILTDKLVELVDSAEKGSVDEDAEKVLGMMLKSLGYSVGPFDEVAWLKAVTEKGVSAAQQKKAAEMVNKYRKDFGNTGFIKKVGPILDALSSDSSGAEAVPEDVPPPVAAVDAVPLPRDLAAIRGDTNAVMALFYRRNLKVTRERTRLEVDNSGQITGITIAGFSIDDISPLAALPNLEVLRCSCSRADEPGQFKEPLAFKYFRLRELTLTGWKIIDYSFLRRMTSLKILGLSGTDIKDIFCLAPLALDELDLSNTKVFSFAVLERMRLKKLNMSGTQLKTFDFVKRMALEELRINETGTTDISFLRGLNIKCLHMANIRAKDFSVLRTLPLIDLTVARTKFDDLTILDGKDIRYLDISGTDISNISLLKSMSSLVELNISDTRVTDISPLENCPIAYFNCQNTRISDFRPLKALPLKSLTIDRTDSPAGILRNLNLETMTSLNGYSLWGESRGPIAYRALSIDRDHPRPPRH